MHNDTRFFDRFGEGITRFLRLESAAGLVMLAAALAAIVIKNSPLEVIYSQFLLIEGQVRLGAISVEKPLFLWVNDFLMAIFFFMVALELKRETINGQLSDRRQVILPAMGALGGIIAPALIYLYITKNEPGAAQGWAVPTATDIAFALTVLMLVGKGLPASLKVFLMTLAILDDLAAIVIIAFFYTSGLSLESLSIAAVLIGMLWTLNRRGVSAAAPYLVIGIVLWVCVLKSGVHATLAGVVTAFFIPAAKPGADQHSPLDSILHDLHPWVAFGILPLFAFVNAGVALEGLSLDQVTAPIPFGIMLGLLLGKPIGVLLFTVIAVFAFKAALPQNATWRQMTGIACLCGIGFTMSLFIAGLAFAEGGAGYARVDRLGILIGSLLSAVVGFLILRSSLSRESI